MPVITIVSAAVLLILCRKKMLERRIFLLLLALDLLGGAAMLAQLTGGGAETVTEIPLSQMEEAGTASLEVETDRGEHYEIEIAAPERQWTTEEAQNLMEEAVSGLDSRILGKNDSFDHVEWNLVLEPEIGEGPVHAEWYTDQTEILGFDGVIQPGVPDRGTTVELYAELTLQDLSEQVRRTLVVFPSREETSVREEILYQGNRINQNLTKADEVYRLPESAAGRTLIWQEPKESAGMILSVLALLGGLLGVLAKRERLEKARSGRTEQLLQDYPELISKLQLYLSAGLSMRNIFIRISAEYQERRNNGLEERCAYEEMRTAVRMMESGTTEMEAYDAFGKACAVPCYRGLALLLQQNLKKGGAGILPQLEREVQDAFEGRKRRARAEGEKTTVKLLLPMAMMLIVVMALILIPAFLSL